MGQAAPVVITVVAVVATVYAGPAVGAAILESMGTTAAAVGVSEAVVGAAAISGASSAVNAAVQGKNIEGVLEAGAKGAATGAAGAAVGGAVSEGVTSATGGPVAVPSDVGPTMGANFAGTTAGGAASGATQGFVGSQLAGRNLDTSLKQAGIGGATGAITAGLSYGAGEAGVPKEISAPVLAAAGPYIRQDVSSLFGGTSPTTPAGTPSQTSTSQPLPSYIASGGGGSVLGSSLSSGGTDISPPVQVGSEPTSSRNVWNVASLRTTDEGGSA